MCCINGVQTCESSTLDFLVLMNGCSECMQSSFECMQGSFERMYGCMHKWSTDMQKRPR